MSITNFSHKCFDVFKREEEIKVEAKIKDITGGPDFITLSYLEILKRISNPVDIQFLEDVAFGVNNPLSDKTITLSYRIWPLKEPKLKRLKELLDKNIPLASWKKQQTHALLAKMKKLPKNWNSMVFEINKQLPNTYTKN